MTSSNGVYNVGDRSGMHKVYECVGFVKTGFWIFKDRKPVKIEVYNAENKFVKYIDGKASGKCSTPISWQGIDYGGNHVRHTWHLQKCSQRKHNKIEVVFIDSDTGDTKTSII